MLTVLFQIHCPVRVIGADGCFNLKSARYFEEHLTSGRYPNFRQSGFPLAVKDHMVIYAVMHWDSIAIQIGNQFGAIENFLHIVSSPANFT